MATETKQIIEVDIRQAAASLRELQQKINATREEMVKMKNAGKAGTEEYQQALVNLKAEQTEYNRIMRLSVQETKAAEGSYNALVVELAKLKEEWKKTGDEAERQRLTKEINGVKEQLTDLDHSIGNWQRNVGNYENGIIAAFQRMGLGIKGVGVSAKAVIPMIKGVGAALWALAKNPFVIGLSAFIALWRKLSSSLKNNEEDFDRIRIALAPLKVVGVAVQQVFDRLVGVIADAAEAVGRFLERVGLVKGTAAELKAIAKEEDEIEDMQRENRKRDAADRKEANRLRAESYKTEKYTEAERKKMLERAAALEMGIGKRREELAQREAEVQQRKAALTANSRETNDQLAESEAAVDDAMASTYASMGRLNSRLDRLEKGTDSAKDSVQELTDALLDEMTATDKAAEDEITKQIKADEARAKSAEQAAERIRKATESNALAAVGDRQTGAEVSARATIDDEQALATALYEIRKKSNEDRLALLRQFAQEAYNRGDVENWVAYNKQAADLETKIERDAITERARLRRKEAADRKKQLQEEIKGMQTTASLFGSVASAYQAYIQQRVEGGKISEEEAEKEFENVKRVQYAQTLINTAAGVMSVWAGEGTTAYKLLQTAAVSAQGIAAAMQIANTTLGSTAQASQAITSAAVAAPIVINAIPQVQALTSASQEEVLNERAAAQRVYVVYSDIAQAGRKVRVTDSESRF